MSKMVTISNFGGTGPIIAPAVVALDSPTGPIPVLLTGYTETLSGLIKSCGVLTIVSFTGLPDVHRGILRCTVYRIVRAGSTRQNAGMTEALQRLNALREALRRERTSTRASEGGNDARPTT